MDRKHIILLIGCSIFISLILTVLYAFSPLSQEMYRASFSRKFASEPTITQKSVLELEDNFFYIAGTTSDKIYLGNFNTPFNLLVTDHSLKGSKQVEIKLIGIDTLVEPRRFNTIVDSPYFFLSNGVMGEVLRGKIGSWEAKRFMPDSGYYFVEAVPISASSLALRSYSQAKQAYQLAKKTGLDTPYFKFQYGLLEKQQDGLFCVDGKLHYDKGLNKLIYLYSYRNQYIVMDTSLNLSYRGNTIDTFSVAQIKTAHIESNGQSQTLAASPPTNTNLKSCVSGNYLFVQSNLLAQNEDEKKFIQGSVIDIYNLTNGTYLNSFYIPNYKKSRVVDFLIDDQKLIALFDRHLVTYDLTQ